MSVKWRERGGAWAMCAVLVAGLVAFAGAPAATAADSTQFDPGFIISDENFYNSSAMTKAQISAFLLNVGANCRTSGSLTCIKDKTFTSVARAADDRGLCGALGAKTNESAANAIYRVALACGINPQVILVTLQKEQGLITNPKSETAYQRAMGYGCPDTPPGCDPAYFGFVYQIYRAARQFQIYKLNPTEWNYQAGRYNDIKYHPTCAGTRVYIQNQATAGLYNYTPYQPNPAALAAGYGTGDGCSSYGNRNFWLYFTDWFGNPGNLLSNGGFENGAAGWSSGVKTVGVVTKLDPAQAVSGSRYASTSTTRAGSSLRHSVARSSSAGQVYSASIWVRSRTAGVPFVGKLRLTATGGTAEYITTPFTAVDTWQEVRVSLPITRSHSGFWIDVYQSTKGVALALDGAVLSKGESAPIRQTFPVRSAGFEGTMTGWTKTAAISKIGVRTNLAGWPAAQGSSFLLAQGSQKQATVKQSVPAHVVKGRTYTATVMVRTSSAAPFEGAIVLRGLGGASDAARTDFVAGQQWTPVQVSYTPKLDGLTALQLDIRLNTPGAYLHIDDVKIATNQADDPSSEATAMGPWGAGVGTVTTAALVGGATHPEIPDSANALTVTRTSASVASLQARVFRKLIVGDSYTASVLLAGQEGQQIRGSLRVWGIGSSTEYTSTAFTLDGADAVLVSTPFSAEQVGAGELRVELYLNTTGVPVVVDGLWVN